MRLLLLTLFGYIVVTMSSCVRPQNSARLATVPDDCAVNPTTLVPNCGVLWGAAAGGHTTQNRATALKTWETLSGRTATLYHIYRKAKDVFPTAEDLAMIRDPQNPRILLVNWKLATFNAKNPEQAPNEPKWRDVALGKTDQDIEAFVSRVKAAFKPGERFFLVLHHEPENDVGENPVAGMEAKDFADMFRYVSKKLKDADIPAVFVISYLGIEKWLGKPWWKDLYPGDEYVDWIGLDSYASVLPNVYHSGDFASILDRKPPASATPSLPIIKEGFYSWAESTKKPLMVSEWGAYHDAAPVDWKPSTPGASHPNARDKSTFFGGVVQTLLDRPAIKAIVYFDTPKDEKTGHDISINSTESSLDAFRTLASHKLFKVKVTSER